VFVAPLLGLQSLAIRDHQHPVRGESPDHWFADAGAGAEAPDPGKILDGFAQRRRLRISEFVRTQGAHRLGRVEQGGRVGTGGDLQCLKLYYRGFQLDRERGVL
jgi:hypothetical protein